MAAVLLAGLAGCGYWFGSMMGGVIEKGKEGAAFATAAVTDLAGEWDLGAMKALATPEYWETLAGQGDILKLRYDGLGALETLDPCTVVSINITNGDATAEVKCPAKFASGAVDVLVDLAAPQGAEWKITDFQVQL